jgi:invasion protein IalB
MMGIEGITGAARRGYRRAVAFAGAVALVLTATGSVQAAQPRSGDSFKDWSVQCETPPGGSRETCYIYQNLLLKNGQQRLLHIAVGYLAKSGKAATFITLPLGVSLPGGVSLSVDDGPARRFRYERCEANGCLAPLMLNDGLIRSFKAGREVRVTFFDGNRREVSVPVSLLGFTAGFNALAQR